MIHPKKTNNSKVTDRQMKTPQSFVKLKELQFQAHANTICSKINFTRPTLKTKDRLNQSELFDSNKGLSRLKCINKNKSE
ncbi:MAG TPA: hypothetical protein DCX89_07170 [Saprospirales bacterium]|nr:hypothetical protein [Saprospirales bacterium]